MSTWDLRFRTRYPTWVAVLLGAGFGAIGYLLVAGGLVATAGWTGPVVILLAPALVGIVAELVIRAGWGVAGLALGAILAAQLAPLLFPVLPPVAIIDLVLYLAAGTIGYTVGAGILLAPSMPDIESPPAQDLIRIERDARSQLRAIDPASPGAFERSLVLLHRVNEEVERMPYREHLRDAGDDAPAAALLEIQAEIVETVRLAATNAGARRVTVSSSGTGGFDVEAVFGETGPEDDASSRPLSDVD